MTALPLIGPVEAPGLHIATFNIRRRMPPIGPRSADRWATRAPAVAALLEAERPHLLGTQEALADQDRFLRDTLGAPYTRLGHGRDANGQGEGTPLYFDNGRLELLEWEQKALSDTPDVPGSRSWGNITPRELVQATFRDRATGIRFLAVNTHLDNMSRRSRVRSAALLRSLIDAQQLPAILTGDFNSGEDTAPLDALLDGGELQDAWSAAHTRLTAEFGTFPNYREPRRDRKRIDWIVVSRGIDVSRVGINTARPGGVWASDHMPVQAVVTLPAAAPVPPSAAAPDARPQSSPGAP